jgi:3'(2'), 5'-bisphosphate nucleotidase
MGEFERLARLFGFIAVRAGEAIIKVRENASRPDCKTDGPPVTIAGLQSEELIRSCLERNLPALTVVSEQTCLGAAERFIMLYPLNGTKEFIQGREEFTINIALIQRGEPMVGAVYAPALHHLYIGGTNAYKLAARSTGGVFTFSRMRPIAAGPVRPKGWRTVVSQSHLNAATEAWGERHAIADRRPSRSFLKFCFIAEGKADVYPRLGPTAERDTAAGQAILLAAGGAVTDPDGRPVFYGKSSYRNREFVAWAANSGSSI